MHLHKVNSRTSADKPYYPAHCIVQEVMESVVSDSFCVTISDGAFWREMLLRTLCIAQYPHVYVVNCGRLFRPVLG